MTEDNFHPLPEDFAPVGADEAAGERITRPSLSFWREAYLRLKRDPVTIVCVALLLLIVLCAIFLPYASPFDYASQNVAFANKPFFSADPVTGATHLFGTDYLGRDIFVRAWYGARVSLTVAFSVTLIDCVVGVLYGGLSGYLGGRADLVMMRVLEVISGIPYLIVVLLFMAVLPRGLLTLIVAYSVVGWTGMARLTRGQVLGLKKQEFVVAARIMGAGPGRMILHHFAPNMLGVIIVNITLDIPGVIFTEAFLSMLGLGIAPPFPSLGVMANEGIANFRSYPAQLAVPALLICLTMLAFNLLGDRLQDVLDPKLRRALSIGRNSKHRASQGDV